MKYKKTTQIPNIVLAQYLRTLSASELKILLVILRQAYGWRKTRDRISYSQFMEKTGYSRRILTKAIQSLKNKGLITITGRKGNTLNSRTRRSKACKMIFFGVPDKIVMAVGVLKSYKDWAVYQRLPADDKLKIASKSNFFSKTRVLSLTS